MVFKYNLSTVFQFQALCLSYDLSVEIAFLFELEQLLFQPNFDACGLQETARDAPSAHDANKSLDLTLLSYSGW